MSSFDTGIAIPITIADMCEQREKIVGMVTSYYGQMKLPDHARHFSVDLFCEAAKQDIARYCKQAIETSNRSFGQMIRQHRERMERVMLESENFGDDAGCCSGLSWGNE